MLALWLAGHRSVDARLVIAFGWLVLVTNAMNFIDNMDGLASGTAAIAMVALAAIAVETGAGSRSPPRAAGPASPIASATRGRSRTSTA